MSNPIEAAEPAPKPAKEYREPVITVRVHMLCQKCGQGEFIFTGESAHNTFRSFCKHKCDQCGGLESFGRHYPCIEYESAGTPVDERKLSTQAIAQLLLQVDACSDNEGNLVPEKVNALVEKILG